MRKAFIDTNIILRYLLGESDSDAIDKLFKGSTTLIVPDIVIAEVVWTLGRFYKWDKTKTIEFLLVLLKNGNIEFNENLIFATFNSFLKHNIKYTDAYIGELMKQSKIKNIYSFDHDFENIPNINRKKP